MKIALGQIDTTVGDLAGNVGRMAAFARRASALGADLIAFPELSIAGYPPRDLVEKESFLERSECAVRELARDGIAPGVLARTISVCCLLLGFRYLESMEVHFTPEQEAQ